MKAILAQGRCGQGRAIQRLRRRMGGAHGLGIVAAAQPPPLRCRSRSNALRCARIAAHAALAQLVEQPPCNSDAVVVAAEPKAKHGKALGSPAGKLRGKPNTV